MPCRPPAPTRECDTCLGLLVALRQTERERDAYRATAEAATALVVSLREELAVWEQATILESEVIP